MIGIHREYLSRVTILGNAPSTDAMTMGISRIDWWFMRIRTPGPPGTRPGRGMAAPPTTLRIRNSVPDRNRCHAPRTVGPYADNIRATGQTTMRWNRSLTEKKSATKERAA